MLATNSPENEPFSSDNLLSRVSVPSPPEPDAEDIFSSALSTMFTDDVVVSWGTPGNSIIYDSPRFGPLSLQIPVHPDEEQGRRLFAHYLWNAGLVAANAIEVASQESVESSADDREDAFTRTGQVYWDRRFWNMRGQRMLELGAGKCLEQCLEGIYNYDPGHTSTASSVQRADHCTPFTATSLPSLIAALSGAATTVITDHPTSPALTSGAIQANVLANLKSRLTETEMQTPSPEQHQQRTQTRVEIYGYTWGTRSFYDPTSYGRVAHSLPPPQSASTAFPTTTSPSTQPPPAINDYPKPTKILLADCLWMPSQHMNLIRTILDFLPESDEDGTATKTSLKGVNSKESTTPQPCALVTAGFHTGRVIVRDFFALATGHSFPSFSVAAPAANGPQPQPVAPAEGATAAQHPLESLSSDDRALVGKLRLAQIFETEMTGRRREWVWDSVREGEGKWEAKRWVVVGALVRR
jgi:hypothetical protein